MQFCRCRKLSRLRFSFWCYFDVTIFLQVVVVVFHFYLGLPHLIRLGHMLCHIISTKLNLGDVLFAFSCVLRRSIGIVVEVAGIGTAYSAPLVHSHGQLHFDLDPAPSSSSLSLPWPPPRHGMNAFESIAYCVRWEWSHLEEGWFSFYICGKCCIVLPHQICGWPLP